jgi:hypothetical protein
MQQVIRIIILPVCLALLLSCSEDNGIENQEGYPGTFADNWIAFEFQGGDIEGTVLDPYNLVSSLDPNRPNSLIIDRLYNADVRVRAAYTDSSFSVSMGEQLDKINTNNYGIEYVSLDGYITSNPVLTNFAFRLANAFYENLAFYESDISDVIFIRAGFYDSLQVEIDTVLIIGYRKTGFEDVNY